MRSINKVVLVGNLTRDPEMRQTPNGQNVVTFGLATNREWVTNDGRKQQSTEFHDLVAWARLADICNQHLKKGKLVYVEGYLKTRSWDSQEGTKKFRTEIVVQDMIMLDKRSDGEDYIPDTIEETATAGESNDDKSEEAKVEASAEASTAEENNAEEEEPDAVEEKEKTDEPSIETSEQDRPAEKPVDQAEQSEASSTADESSSEKKDDKKEPVAAGSNDKLDIDSDLGL